MYTHQGAWNTAVTIIRATTIIKATMAPAFDLNI